MTATCRPARGADARNVVAGLAVMGLGTWAVAPNLVRAILPLLLLAACPLSMLLMTRDLQGGQCASRPHRANQPTRSSLTRTGQHEPIACDIARLEAADSPAMREVQAFAGAADGRARVMG